MQRRLRQVFSSVREHTVVSYAKIATAGGFCDLDLIVVKATSPDDLPLPDRYVHELQKLFSISPTSYRDFAISFTRRFGKTQCWRVALKCLVLLHRLLRSLPDNSAFRNQLLWTRSNGYLTLYPCQFRDFSSSSSEDFTNFIRSYAELLDEALDCGSIGKDLGAEEELTSEHDDTGAFHDKMKVLDEMLELLPQVQNLIDRVMDCRPTGAAARNFVVQSAMKHIMRDSFICYTTFRRDISVVLEHLIQMPYRSCIAAFGIYKRAALQADQLCEFYDWCKSLWLCGLYEYPFIDKIPQIQIQALEAFVNGMWQLSESSSSSSSTESSVTTLESLLCSTDDVHYKQLMMRPENMATDTSTTKENGAMILYNKDHDLGPLIQFDDDEHASWEVLLEASINSNSFTVPKNILFGHAYGYGSDYISADVSRHEENRWQIQVYDPYAQKNINPFDQSYDLSANLHGLYSSNPTY